jgi:hypothetical protein
VARCLAKWPILSGVAKPAGNGGGKSIPTVTPGPRALTTSPSPSGRLAGTLLGTALGDALRLPCKGMSARSITRRFGRVDRFRFLGKTGFVSDDSIESLLHKAGYRKRVSQ